MNALAIDCAVSKIAVAAKKDSKSVKLVLDIGSRQSEKLLPALDYVMSEMEMEAADLDYTVSTLGPGTFTGLRLGLSTLKALTLSHGKPLYGVPSLDAYRWPLKEEKFMVLSLITAKEDEYFCALYSSGKKILEDSDLTLEEILKLFTAEDSVTLCGPGAKDFFEQASQIPGCPEMKLVFPAPDCADSLFEIAEKMISENVSPMADYDGPVYVRKSEAEIVYESTHPAKDGQNQ